MTRALNIALRTAHIGAMGTLLGGHAFDVAPERLLLSLWLTVGTGLVLAALETGGKISWLHEARGVMTLVKIGLLFLVLLAWSWRLPILLTVVVVGSVGSHMPRRYRHYSLLYRRVIDPRPGKKRAGEAE
jgi:hypothetical protein